MASTNPDLTFGQLIRAGKFCYGGELVTTRGIGDSEQTHKLIELGQMLADDPRIAWISITDNPGGTPMLPPDWLGRILASRRVRIVIHLTCKDLNRNGLESAAWRYAAEGFDNILALTGDYPRAGYGGGARPVFDLDSVSLIALLHAMNQGLTAPLPRGRTETLPQTDFFIGGAVSPFKRHESELMPQYFKLARKIRCGAQWVIPQLGYDMRKFHEVKLFMDWANVSVPLLGNVYVLNKTVAGMFHQGKIPGCVVNDKLWELVQQQARSADKGRAFFDELAAKQLAVFKGLGFAAGYLAGTTRPERFARIIDLAESYSDDDWRQFAAEIQFSQPDEFYLFEQDSETKLGDGAKLNRQYRASLAHPPRTDHVTAGYRIARKVHAAAFTPGKGQFGRLQKLYTHVADNGHSHSVISRALHFIERVSKNIGFGCKDCGDCALPDCAYLCPRASCSKGTRNGPCGGSSDGRCELDDKECLWARAYERLKYYGETEEMLSGPAVFYNAQLDGGSAWANNFLGRDHYQLTVNGKKPADVVKPQG